MNYFYDTNIDPTIHGIENNGKTLKCNNGYCHCFFSLFSFGMKPQSGKYKIKFKINEISNRYFANIIGIITQNGKNKINEQIKSNTNNNNNNNNNNINSNNIDGKL